MTREDAIKCMMEDAEEAAMVSGNAQRIVVCQGEPRCSLDREGQRAAMAENPMDGCAWCERYTLSPGGEWTIDRPSES